MTSTQNVVIGLIVLLLALVVGWYTWTTYGTGTPSAVYINADENMIKLDLVKPGVTVLPRFTVTGEARGQWFFEATFPAEILDKDGKQIASTYGEALSDWMTEDFVQFRVNFDVDNYSGPAVVILHKANASGLPEHDASLTVPIEVMSVE